MLLIEIWGLLRHVYNIAFTYFQLLDLLGLVSRVAEKVVELLLWQVLTLGCSALAVSVLASLVEVRMVTTVS